MHDLGNKLSKLGFSGQDVQIFSYLLENGAQSAGRLAKALRVPRASLYGFLKKLSDKGLIFESLRSGVKLFSAVKPQQIDLLYQQQIEQLQTSREDFKKILPLLEGLGKKQNIFPKFQLFEGEDGVRQVLKDMLLYYDLETLAFWPIKSMIEILTPDFFRYLNKERIKNRLYTRAIWPADQVVEIKKHPFLGVGKDFLREIRVAPAKISFSMGYWMYGNRTAFISSRKENFGFIIESQELAEMLRTQFEVLWDISKPLKVDSKNTASFLKEVKSYQNF